MQTHDYLNLLNKVKNATDYRISKDTGISQQTISNYRNNARTLSERHAFIFARELGINPAIVIAETKLENAKIKDKKADIEFWQEQLNYYAGKTYALPNGQKVTHQNGEFILC